VATIGQLLRALFGYTSNPEWITLITWLTYVVVVMFLYLRPMKPVEAKPVAGNQPAVGS
jgi:high-affinity Fe2+/Pb2+ permease